MKLYLAGPMTGYPDHNVPEFDRVAAELRAKGFEVVTPADITRGAGFNPASDGSIPPEDYSRLFFLDEQAIYECDGIALMYGWAASRGAKVEAQLAMIHCKPFYDAYTGKPRETPKFIVEVL